ncbi:hypothetical protein FRZ03_02535 [Streptomyces misionensis]|uniref:Uncharacterized protein n=1 Tax=Streptomyces misionensis TaxID=67331 RepID=A0A5C6K3I0_9ACTN|nr:hypothetical protein FRZ03_02535 [Streptomyces misionensis]
MPHRGPCGRALGAADARPGPVGAVTVASGGRPRPIQSPGSGIAGTGRLPLPGAVAYGDDVADVRPGVHASAA